MLYVQIFYVISFLFVTFNWLLLVVVMIRSNPGRVVDGVNEQRSIKHLQSCAYYYLKHGCV